MTNLELLVSKLQRGSVLLKLKFKSTINRQHSKKIHNMISQTPSSTFPPLTTTSKYHLHDHNPFYFFQPETQHLFTFPLHSDGGRINQVFSYNSKQEDQMVYVVTDDGYLYQAKYDNIPTGKEVEFKLVPMISHSLKVVAIAGYSDSMLLSTINVNTLEYAIYGKGNNIYCRMSVDKEADYTNFNTCFSPSTQSEISYNSNPIITHIGCCFSFSVCVINNTDVHFTGRSQAVNFT